MTHGDGRCSPSEGVGHLHGSLSPQFGISLSEAGRFNELLTYLDAGGPVVMILIVMSIFALDGVEMPEQAVIEIARQRLQLAQNTESIRLRLKADGGTPANRIVQLMQRRREAGFHKLKLLTVPKV